MGRKMEKKWNGEPLAVHKQTEAIINLAISCQCVMETSEQVESNRREMLARQRRQMIKKDSRAISPKLG